MRNLFQLDAKHYYFTRTEYLKSEIENRSYYFSSPISFNDPFDCDFHHLEKFVDSLSEDELGIIKENSRRDFERRKLTDLTRDLTRQVDEGYIDIFGIRAIQRNSNKISSDYLEKKYDELSNVEKIGDLSEYKRELKVWFESTLKEAGVKCLTSKWFSAPMWAHYGNIHRGVCVGVYFPDNMFKKWQHNVGHSEIDYVDEMYVPTKDMYLRNLIQRFMTRKYKEWEYEDESRIISFRKSGYIPFRCSSLREIILGAKWFDDPRTGSSFEDRYNKLELMEYIFSLRRSQGRKKCKIFLSYVERGSRYVRRSEVPCNRLSRIIGALNRGLDSENSFQYVLNA